LTFRYQGLRPSIVARFDMPHASSDGGLVLLKAVDERLGLTETLAACLTDGRQPGKVTHSRLDLVRQRVFRLVAGYLDGNDAARLADDPLHKLVLDREPLTGPALGSQPTLSRFENGISRRDLVRVGQGLARAVIAHHRRRLHGRTRRRSDQGGPGGARECGLGRQPAAPEVPEPKAAERAPVIE
jgi:hypothetical protein